MGQHSCLGVEKFSSLWFGLSLFLVIVMMETGTVHMFHVPAGPLAMTSFSQEWSVPRSQPTPPQPQVPPRYATMGCFRFATGPLRVTTNDEERKSKPSTQGGSWNQRQDWILEDQVPRFTVHSLTTIATFWTQLRHSTPELSFRTEQELEERYRDLLLEKEEQSRQQPTTTGTGTGTGTTKKKFECGPSPLLLSNWWVERERERERADNNVRSAMTMTMTTIMVGGTLANGSTIWFPLQRAGTFRDDPRNVLTGSSSGSSGPVMNLEALGYVEALGGQLYELGEPKKTRSNYRTTDADVDSPKLLTSGKFVKKLLQDMSSSTGYSVYVAAVASSIISFSLAFIMGAGTQNQKSLTNNHPHGSNANSNTAIVLRTSSAKTTSVPTTQTPENFPEMSIGVQRARMELKVERDQVMLKKMTEKLQRDEQSLKDLRREEQAQEKAQ